MHVRTGRSVISLLLAAGAVMFAVGTLWERAGTESGGAAEHVAREGGERIAGLSVEAGPLVAVTVVLSLALAVWVLVGGRAALVTTALTSVAFAALDAAEVLHQWEAARHGLAAWAATLAVVHAAAAWLADRARQSSAVEGAG